MADAIKFTNTASALLAATITDIDTVVQVASGYGALFPNPGVGEYFYVVLEADNGDYEIVKCTSRSTDNLTVVRAQEGTTAKAFTLTVTRVEVRLTAASLQEMLQKNGGTMTGDIDVDGNNVVDAVLTGSLTSIQGGEIANGVLRGATGVTGNQILIPADGTSRPTIGGADILIDTDNLIPYLISSTHITFDLASAGEFRLGGTNNGIFRMYGGGVNFNLQYDAVTDNRWEWTFTGGPLYITGASILLGAANLYGSHSQEVYKLGFKDNTLKNQDKTATATTDLDYELGSYVRLTLGTSITSLTFSNVPASAGTKTSFFRLKIVPTLGSETITWPAGFKWPNDVEPTFDTAGGVYFVDCWTEDGGTTWYATFAENRFY